MLAADLFAIIDGFAVEYAFAHTVEVTMSQNAELTMYTDRRSLHELCIWLALTTERRLQIKFLVIRDAYESRGFTNVVCIKGRRNPADGLTKIE